MGAHLIDQKELGNAVARAGTSFATKDVSEQHALKRVHPALSGHSHWHAFVGRALSMHRGSLQITEAGYGSRGARWTKSAASSSRPLASARGHEPPTVIVRGREEVSSRPHDVGPQSPSDNSFTRRMRLHQSRWRARVLMVPCGTGPSPTSPSRYGNMLDEEAAEAGKNFLSDAIFQVVKRRIAEGSGAVEPFRLMRNLLSSQPMCFNLFGPLVDDVERATRFMRSLLGEEVKRVRHARIEWAPSPREAHLNDRTAFDAFVDYERADGTVAAIGFETKLTDSFSQKPYDSPSYRRWMSGQRSPFKRGASSAVSAPMHNQLWRNHLLAISTRDAGHHEYADVYSGVIVHPLDLEGASVVSSYRTLLRDDAPGFHSFTLEDVIAAFERVATESDLPWLRAFRQRYLDVDG